MRCISGREKERGTREVVSPVRAHSFTSFEVRGHNIPMPYIQISSATSRRRHAIRVIRAKPDKLCCLEVRRFADCVNKIDLECLFRFRKAIVLSSC